MYNINLLDHWNPVHHDHISNFIDVERRVLLGLDISYLLRNIHILHNIGVSAVVQQNIVDVWPVTSSASAAVFLSTADEYSTIHLPHARLVLKQSQ